MGYAGYGGCDEGKEQLVKEGNSLLKRRIESDKPAVDEDDRTNLKDNLKVFQIVAPNDDDNPRMMRRMSIAKRQRT